MGLVTVTHDEAKFAHQSFYEGDFEVVSMARSGFSDYFPFSLAYGISDIGSWSGLISTDGKKMVVTRSKALDLAKVKKSFEIEVADISKVKFNIAKTYFTFNKKIPGLTMPSVHWSIKILTIGVFTPILYPFLSKKTLIIRIDDEFENKDAFADLLKK